ncbi:30S ribosomal protein S5 [Candidatus Woesebacteria bacterium RIFCSPHIGHO2_01_FULL_41_10]|uniref:Small ribosomal subunit protein uS5 n=1 Tax=Candidatus Woesebacteria bacterium RIFCSPHIGHO2_01_FULL_41_10 TaxID=1802500 RepID=A0A1F7YSI1_9BACT|nr:MAG: 30S ribosomal protein S5 [Candidatus Woesebacteria bacterium RIFCSPHIGHO2_01_FULL_41_10]
MAAQNYHTPDAEGFIETVVQINRVSKKTKGGNTMRFNALVVVGDRQGQVGAAIAKARDVRGAIQKAIKQAKLAVVTAPLMGTTVPFEVTHKYGAAKVLIKPAPPGSGIIAGGPMRVVLEAAGARDAVGKILGTNNKTTNVFATIETLEIMSKMQVLKKERK